MANKYLVAGNGNVSSTTNWSDTSGGASGAVKPGPGDDVIVNSLSGVVPINVDEGTTWASLSITGRAVYDSIRMAANLTITGLMTQTGNNASTQRLYVFSSATGTARILSCGSKALTNVDYEDITAAGAGAPFTGTSIGNCGGNTNITPTTPISCYWNDDATASHVLTDALWFTTSGGAVAARFPLPQDTGYLDANSFSAVGRTLAVGITNLRVGSLVFTGATNTPTLNIGHILLSYGTLTLIEGMTLTQTSAVYFAGRGAYTLASAGKTFPVAVNVYAPGGTLTLQDVFLSTAPLNINFGTLLSAFDVTSSTYAISAGAAHVQSGGTLKVTGSGAVWTANVSATLTFTGSTVAMNDASATAKTFAGGGKTYDNITLSGGGNGTFDFTGSNILTGILDIGAQTFRGTAGASTTFADMLLNGGTIGSITAGTHTLIKTGGGTVTVTSATISYSTATPSDSFFANYSTDGGNNPGWRFQYGTGPLGLITYNDKVVTLTQGAYRFDQPDRNHAASRTKSASGKVETLNVRVDERVSVSFRNFRKSDTADATLKRQIQQWLQWAQNGNDWTFSLDGLSRVHTTLTAAAAVGATTLALTSVGGIIANKTFIIRSETQLDVVKVLTVGASTVTIAEGLNFAFTVGDRFRSEHCWRGKLMESINPISERPPLFWDLDLDFFEDLNDL